MTVGVLWLFLVLPWVGLQCVIVLYPSHTRLLFFTVHKMSFHEKIKTGESSVPGPTSRLGVFDLGLHCLQDVLTQICRMKCSNMKYRQFKYH